MQIAWPDLTRRYLPLYLGLYGLGLSALLALSSSVNAPAYNWLLHLAFLAGCAASFHGAVTGRLHLIPGIFFLVAGFTAYGLRQMPAPLISLLYPPEILAQNDLALAGLVGWFLVGFSYWQGSRPNLIFCVVCALALFGLVGTLNLNIQTWLLFCTCLLCIVFCWGYEQFLEIDDGLAASGRPRFADWRAMARGHLAVAALLAALALGAGHLAGTGIYNYTPNLYAQMAEQVYGWELAQRLNWNYATFAEEFRIGTGPTELSYEPVMTVNANEPALWRGAVYDFYDGRGWSRTSHNGQRLPGEGPTYNFPDPYVIADPSTRLLRQRYEVLAFNNQFFAVATPLELILQKPPVSPPIRMNMGSDMGMGRGGAMRHGDWKSGVYLDAYGCLSWNGSSAVGLFSYEVVSVMPPDDPKVLRQAIGEYPDWISNTSYLQVPAGTAVALRGLVTELTLTKTTSYDKVTALQSYLETRCLYSLRAPPVPYGQDVVTHFVLRSHRGACDQFASALVIMCRLAGVPARIVTGFATGEEETVAGVYTVRGKDAHAWVEALLPGIGWVTFNPHPEGQENELSWWQLLLTNHWDMAGRQALRVAGWVILSIILLVLALSAVLDPLALLRQLRRRPPGTELAELAREYQNLYTHALHRWGVASVMALTPQEATSILAAALPDRAMKLALVRLNEAFYGQRYAQEANETEVRRLRQELRELRRELRRRARR